jgi:hypothetical protein
MKLYAKFIIGSLLFAANSMEAQYQFVLTLNNNEVSTVPVPEIQSIKFDGQTMNLFKTDGSSFSWLTSDINNYRFDNVTSTSLAEEIETSQIEIYPNPSNGQAVFSYSSPDKQRVSIGIFDLLGQEILMLYSGIQEGKQTYSLDTQIPSGIYICKVVGERRIWTKSFIVN